MRARPSSRAIVFDHAGAVRGAARQEFRQICSEAGWVEHDPVEIWRTQLATARQALARAGLDAAAISALGITNQRETTVVWDRKTGEPVHNAIVWQDRRTAGFCDGLKRAGHAGLIQSKTGLVIDAYFSGSKLRWILDHVPGARERARRGELAFGTINTWLVWNLTGGGLHVTDPSNASRTMLFNLHTGDWDQELLDLFQAPRAVLPQVRASSEPYGETVGGLFKAPILISGIAGDQQAALFGQSCFTRGLAKNTYGTGCFMLMNIGTEPLPSRRQLLATVAWRVSGQTDFALEGSVFMGGAVVQWLRDGLRVITSSAEVERLARTVPDSGGIFLVPAFAGLGAPHWDQYARGTITGLTRGSTAGHLARAALEGIAFQVADILDVMRIRIRASPSANSASMAAPARTTCSCSSRPTFSRRPVVRPKVIETTAWGAASLAGLAAGFWKGREEIQRAWQPDWTFEPRMSADEAAHRRKRWAEALRRARDWEEHE